jgi:hypothetical protein
MKYRAELDKPGRIMLDKLFKYLIPGGLDQKPKPFLADYGSPALLKS